MSQSTFVKSTFILSIATLLSKILGSIFRIPLQNIAGDEVLGIFSMVYPVYMVALILSVAGIPIAISKLIAEARAKNEVSSIRDIYITASILAILFGVLSFSILYGFSHSLANALGGPETRLSLIVVGMTLLVAPYMAVYRGFFQGFEDMTPTAVSQVLEQLIRVGLILVIAYFLVSQNYTNDIIAGGVMVGSVVGAIASLIYLRLTYSRSPLKLQVVTQYSFHTFTHLGKKILSVSFPIAIGAITMALLNFVDSFTIPIGLRSAGIPVSEINYMFGIYGRGLSLVQIATVFATSIVLPLIPYITKKLAENDEQGTRKIINQTHHMTHLISWPAAMGLLALTVPLNIALFTNMEGSLVLAIIGFSSVFTSLTVLGTGILQGMNLAKVGALIIVFGVVLKVFTNIFFIKSFGITGAGLSTLIVYIVLVFINVLAIKRRISFTFINRNVVMIIIASIVMGAVIGIPTFYLAVESFTRFQALLYVFAAIGSGAIIYFLQLFVFKVINKNSLESIPIIGKRLRGRRKDHE